MTRHDEVTVIGGGLAGLIAAVEVAEAGVPVRLLEARRRLGGRATSTPGAWSANLGPHALYAGTGLWTWLRGRGLDGGARRPSPTGVRWRWRGAARSTPPAALLRPGLVRGPVPVEVDLRTWATDRWGPGTADAVAGLAGPLTFDADPGRLSAAFVVERVRRVLLHPRPTARYVPGGWSTMVGGLADHARRSGVRIELDAAVDAAVLDGLRSAGPVVLAVEPGAARRLLGEDEVGPGAGRRVALLDVGLRAARDPYVVLDLDEAIFWTRPSAVLDDLAPAGSDLLQLSGGLRSGETLDDGERRLERVIDAFAPGWRYRVEWRRRAVVKEATGAVDLPGRTWRDRPAIDRGDGLWLAGDWVAAPGHLAEVSWSSAVTAAAAAVTALRTARPPARSARRPALRPV